MKKATPPEEERSPSHGHDTSTAAQCIHLLEHLYLRLVDSIAAHQALNIAAPTLRVNELHNAGYPIQTRLIRLNDDQGRPHRLALYYLGTVQQPNQE